VRDKAPLIVFAVCFIFLRSNFMEAVLNGPTGRTVLGSTELRIGRAPDNQLVISDTKASGHHAEIRPDGDSYSIVDVGSTNGTFVNEQQLARDVPRRLNSGDVIRIGDMTFTYEGSGASAIPPTVYADVGSGGSEPAYQPTVAAPPPFTDYNQGAQQGYQPPPPPPPAYSAYPPPPQTPYAPPQPSYMPPMPPVGVPPYPGYGAPVQPRRSQRGLWLTLGIVGGVLVLLCVAFSVFAYVNRSTPTRTLTTFCTDLTSGNYHDAYQQLSSSAQSQQSESKFTSSFRSGIAFLGGLNDCTISDVTEGSSTATGVMTWSVNNTQQPIVFDAGLIDESDGWKIDSLKNRQ
jgi:predicted component of type VI protein secretion system